MGEIRIGTSGWDYADWVGVFYPQPKRKFEFYSKVFSTVEIDSTFYSLPSPRLVYVWERRASKGFVFSAKIPKIITHKKELKLKLGVEDDLDLFLNLMSPLKRSGKLGPLLFQLPPSLKFDLGLLEDLLDILPGEFMFAIEFRDMSWLRDETFRLLRKYNVAYTIVDEPYYRLYVRLQRILLILDGMVGEVDPGIIIGISGRSWRSGFQGLGMFQVGLRLFMVTLTIIFMVLHVNLH